MTKRCLVMLTESFPYAAGEEFIAPELELVAQKFAHVFVIPTRAPQGGSVALLPLPENCEVVVPAPAAPTPSARNAAVQRLRALLHTPSIYAYSPLLRPGRARADKRFAAAGWDLYQRLRAVLPAQRFAEYDSVVFYAYWLKQPAFVATLLRDQLLPRNLREHAVVVSRADIFAVDTEHYLPGRRYLLNNLDQIYPNCRAAQQQLRHYGARHAGQFQLRRLGVPELPARQRELPGLVSLGSFYAQAAAPQPPAGAQPPQPLHLLSCSNMEPYKRLYLLINVIAELQQRGVQVQWTHVGEANPDRYYAVKKAAETQLKPGTFRLTGQLPAAQVHELMANPQFHFFLNTSRVDGMPIAILEALAAGLPVIATAAGGIPEVIHDGHNGRVLPVEIEAADFVNAILELAASDEATYRHYCEAARATWRKHANAQRQYSDFAAHLERISEAACTGTRTVRELLASAARQPANSAAAAPSSERSGAAGAHEANTHHPHPRPPLPNSASLAEAVRAVMILTDNSGPEDEADDTVQPTMIFHVPYSLARPEFANLREHVMKLRQSFVEMGYRVIDVRGSARERNRGLREVREFLRSGGHPEFCYSANTTGMKEVANELATGWKSLVDLKLLRLLHSNGVPVGIFYADVYWKLMPAQPHSRKALFAPYRAWLRARKHPGLRSKSAKELLRAPAASEKTGN